MTASEMRIIQGRRGGGWLRRASMAALGLYLAPAALVVLAIGVLGMACCAALRLAAGDPLGRGDGRGRRLHGPARTIRAPHVCVASRSRSPSR